MDIKQLKKYGSNQLVLKIRKGEFTTEEQAVVMEVLKERGMDVSTLGLDVPPQVKGVPQEVIDFIDKALEENDTDTCSKIGVILGDVDDYEKLSEAQCKALLKLRDTPKKAKAEKGAVKEKAPKAERAPKKEKTEKAPKAEFVMSEEQLAIFNNAEISKSEKMRKLTDAGMTPVQISNAMGSHYSFVFGVIKRYKEEGEKPPKKEKPVKEKKGKKEQTVEEQAPSDLPEVGPDEEGSIEQ